MNETKARYTEITNEAGARLSLLTDYFKLKLVDEDDEVIFFTAIQLDEALMNEAKKFRKKIREFLAEYGGIHIEEYEGEEIA